jgi:transcription initiation factor TFIIB
VTTVAAGTVYIASKAANEPRTLKRIADAAAIEHSELNKTVRCLYRELSEEVDLKSTVTTPEDYLKFLCTDLGLNREVTDQAEILLQDIRQQMVFDGKHPAGVAAAAVYLTAENRPTQRDLAEVAGVATETLRVRLNEFRATREQENV